MINKYNILSFGISSVEDLDLLNKQFKLFQKYSKIPFNFYVMPGRPQMDPRVDNMELIKNSLPKNYQCIIPEYLKNNVNIMQNMSIFVGYSLNEFFNTVPKEKYFIIHLDCLPINYFDINEWAEDKPLFFIEQHRNHLRYAWDNICFIDTNIIFPAEIDFSCGNFEGAQCDTGGGTYKIVNKYPSNCYGHTTKYLSNVETILSSNLSEHNKGILLKNYEIQLAESNAFGDPHWSELFLFDTLFHYRSFSGWHRKDQATLNIKEQRKQLLMDLK